MPIPVNEDMPMILIRLAHRKHLLDIDCRIDIPIPGTQTDGFFTLLDSPD